MRGLPARRALVLLPLVLGLCSVAANAQVLSAFPDRQSAPSVNARRPSSDVEITVPGPLRSFQRMAGISQKVGPADILPLLARNIYVQGYIGWQDRGHATEFLILLGRYVNQAQELADLAGNGGIIRIENCQQAEPLLRILGYRLRQDCGNVNAALITSDEERAFLTTDSGFPLPALEEALRDKKPFEYHYPVSRVPVLFTEGDWTSLISHNNRWKSSLLQSFLHHPSLARLYWAFSRLDPETRNSLKTAPGLGKLLPVAADLDFYGSHFLIRSGRVMVPGGEAAEQAWKQVVGASPDNPSEFVSKLLTRDKGWLAAFYDCIARSNREEQQHFTDPHRLQTLYAAFRGSDYQTDAARPAFRLASGLLLLLNHLQWDGQGNPIIPGDVSLWRALLNEKHGSRLEHDWGKRASHWTKPSQVLDSMFAFARQDGDAGPLQIFLLFSELNSVRPADHPLANDTLRTMAAHFAQYQDQYLLFSEFPQLNDRSVVEFVNAAEAIDKISNHTLRGNAMGTFQAELGIWQILGRQRQIPDEKLNSSFQAVIQPFEKISNATHLFDAGRQSLSAIVLASSGKPRVSEDNLIELLAGPSPVDGEARRIHQELAKSIRSVMDGQRLVSLDTLVALGKGLDEMAHGAAIGKSLLPLAGQLQEFQMPRPIFTSSERSEWAAGVYNNRHTDIQMQTDLSKVLKTPSSPSEIDEARGQLAPFLRDTLVGLNYAYYEPPGSQLLRSNPLFVRSHDFAGETVSGIQDPWRAPQLFGEGSPAGGGAHLVGSLADLPYVLSEAEQDFITPENVQALIWREAVPGLLTNAVFPRWWNISRNELHAVTLHQRAGEELIASAASNPELRQRVLQILSERMWPSTLSQVEANLRESNSAAALAIVTPSDLFHLSAEYRSRFPNDNAVLGSAGQELANAYQRYPNEVNWQRLCRDFGVPHPRLEESYAQDLLNIEPLPAFSGYSSRLMAESWESNNLYWARLADEMGYPPAALNLLVPQLTRRMVEKIFATDFEDWPALLRAMREAGDEFRSGKFAALPLSPKDSSVAAN